jgi:Tfp pilus assembly protein PilO
MTKKEKVIFYVAVIFVCLAFLDRLVYRPIRSKFTELREKILIEEKKVGSNIRNLVQREAILEEYKKFSGYITAIGTDEEEMAEFLKVVEETSRNSNIYMTDIKPQPVIKVDFYKRYVVEVDVEAAIERLMDFMHRLESLNQLINIEGLQLSREKEGSKVIKAHIVVTRILIP